MRRTAWLVGLALTAVLGGGCVERRFVVTTDPPGALVLRNNHPIGSSPADDHFVYYGKYNFTLIADGYETMHVEQNIPTPWYEYWPLDFFFENLFPFQIEDVRHFHYPMTPLQMPNPNDLINQGQDLRNRAKTIEPPPKPP